MTGYKKENTFEVKFYPFEMIKQKVSKKQIYDLLKQMEKSFQLIDTREQSIEECLVIQEKRTDHTLESTNQFERDTREYMRDVKNDILDIRLKLDDIYNNRKENSVLFTQVWLIASLFIVVTMSALGIILKKIL